MFSLILTIIITSLPLLTKNPLVITLVPSTLKVNAPSDIKKTIIDNLISRAKLISSSKTIFYKEIENIKQALIYNGFPNNFVDEQIKRMIKNVNQQNKHCTTPPSQQTYIKLFYRNQMHFNFISHQREQDLVTGRTQNSSNLHALRIMEENVGDNFSRDKLIAEQRKDPNLIPIFKRSLPSEKANKVSECFYLNNGVLMRKWHPLDASPDEEWRVVYQIVVPGVYRQYILDIAHDTLMSGQLGINKTYRKIQNHFYWPRIKQDVAQYCSSYHTCQVCGKPNQKIPPVPPKPIPAFDELFTEVLVDCVGPLPRTKSGNQ